MSKERAENMDKGRKSDARKEFEEMENEGRFAGNDLDAQRAKYEAEQKIQQVEGNRPSQLGSREIIGEDAPPRLDDAQANNNTSEAQNVNNHPTAPGTLSNNDRNIDSATNKAMQDIDD
jgi:hypothetical protein